MQDLWNFAGQATDKFEENKVINNEEVVYDEKES